MVNVTKNGLSSLRQGKKKEGKQIQIAKLNDLMQKMMAQTTLMMKWFFVSKQFFFLLLWFLLIWTFHVRSLISLIFSLALLCIRDFCLAVEKKELRRHIFEVYTSLVTMRSCTCGVWVSSIHKQDSHTTYADED